MLLVLMQCVALLCTVQGPCGLVLLCMGAAGIPTAPGLLLLLLLLLVGGVPMVYVAR
jgi:hypothetical protein